MRHLSCSRLQRGRVPNGTLALSNDFTRLISSGIAKKQLVPKLQK